VCSRLKMYAGKSFITSAAHTEVQLPDSDTEQARELPSTGAATFWPAGCASRGLSGWAKAGGAASLLLRLAAYKHLHECTQAQACGPAKLLVDDARTRMRTKLARSRSTREEPYARTRAVTFFLASGLLMARITGLPGWRRKRPICKAAGSAAQHRSITTQPQHSSQTLGTCLKRAAAAHLLRAMVCVPQRDQTAPEHGHVYYKDVHALRSGTARSKPAHATSPQGIVLLKWTDSEG